MPAAPTAKGTTVEGNIDKPGDYIVKSNVTAALANISNTNIYITNEGELTINSHWGIGENVNIYVLNGGKLHYQSGNIDYNIYVYRDATFDTDKSNIEPTLKSKACLKCLYFTIIIFDLCRYLEYFSYLCTINQTE